MRKKREDILPGLHSQLSFYHIGGALRTRLSKTREACQA